MAPAACPVRGRLYSEKSAKAGEVISKVVPVLPSVVVNYTCEARGICLYFTPTWKPVLTQMSSGRATLL